MTVKINLVELLDARVRCGGSDDIGFMIQTWGHSLRSEYPDVRTSDFVDALRAGIKRRLDAGARVLVACPRHDESVILGWACVGLSAIHFVYVRKEHRRGGLARLLIGATGMSPPLRVDAMTDDLRAIRRAHPETIRYLPNP